MDEPVRLVDRNGVPLANVDDVEHDVSNSDDEYDDEHAPCHHHCYGSGMRETVFRGGVHAKLEHCDDDHHQQHRWKVVESRDWVGLHRNPRVRDRMTHSVVIDALTHTEEMVFRFTRTHTHEIQFPSFKTMNACR